MDKFEGENKRIRDLLREFDDCLRTIEYLQGYLLLFFITGAIFIVVPLISPFAIKNLGMNNGDLQQMYFYGGILTFITSRLIGGM